MVLCMYFAKPNPINIQMCYLLLPKMSHVHNLVRDRSAVIYTTASIALNQVCDLVKFICKRN